jgi:hypothetical protein
VLEVSDQALAWLVPAAALDWEYTRPRSALPAVLVDPVYWVAENVSIAIPGLRVVGVARTATRSLVRVGGHEAATGVGVVAINYKQEESPNKAGVD